MPSPGLGRNPARYSRLGVAYTKALYGFDAVVQRVPADRWGENALPETPDPGDDPAELWNNSRDSLLEALDEPGAVSKVGNYWFGESTIEDILAFSQWDPLVHSWTSAKQWG